MREYELLGHMVLATEMPNQNEMVYYIPHHGVVTSDKFRVVFDASCKTNKGISLNDAQLVGEKLQRDLHEQIMRFRRHRIGIQTDVKKMFRQVGIIPRQRNLQRIFWRESSNDPLREYCLITITYGLASSPHCAVRAMKEGARDMEKRYPRAVQVIKNDFYMDDGLTGTNLLAEAKELTNDMTMVTNSFGFELCKWKSNCEARVTAMEEENPSSVELSGSTLVLGLKWLLQPDEFTY